MTLETAQLDKLNNLFSEWENLVLMYSVAGWDRKLREVDSDKPTVVGRVTMHVFYRIREELRSCIPQLRTEVEGNLLTASREQQDVIYLNKLAAAHNQLTAFLSEEYTKSLERIAAVSYEYEPANPPKVGWVDESDYPTDPYWNEYFTEECLAIDEGPPILIRLIDTIAEGFGIAANNIRLSVVRSPSYKLHPDSISITYPAKPVPDSMQSTELNPKGQWKNLPPKILLLYELGFFELLEVKKLSFESKGKLISTLCGGSADNAVDYIRHCDPERIALENNPYRNPKNVKVVRELLALLSGD